ncbi:MAG: FAD-binding oxidoreductase [Candidatus Promineifilaceae bacterium]
MIEAPLTGIEAGPLKNQLDGTVYTPGDDGYDGARMPWNLSYAAQLPALVVEAASANDVAAAIRFANEHDLGVALQATGHGVILLADDGLLINTAKMNKVSIDPEARTAYVEAGALWGDVLRPAQEAGLAPLLGSSPGVGAVGYTLGGGMGWLVRKYGLAADHVNHFDVVTAAGEQKRVSAEENSELFWGLRGGRSTFAAVTGMEINLFPVTMIYGGSLVYPAPLARPILERYRDWIKTVPEELSSAVALMNIPDMPGVPDMLKGKSVIMVRAAYCGPLEEAESYFQTWQEGPEPIANFLGPMPFSQVAMISQDPEHPMPGYLSGMWLDELNDEVVEAIIGHTFVESGGPPPLIFSEVRHVGGAKGRVAAESNAVDHRQEQLILDVLGMTPTPEIYEAVLGYTNGYMQALAAHSRGVYPNFIEGSGAQKFIGELFSPAVYDRLKRLKATADPDNRFRYGLQFD